MGFNLEPKRIVLGIDTYDLSQLITVKQGYLGSIKVKVSFLGRDKKVFNIPVGSTAKVRMIKPDKKKVLNDTEHSGVVEGNTVTFEITDQMQAYPGNGALEIILFNGAETVTSSTCGIRILENVHDDTGIESTDEWLTVLNTLADLEEKIQNATTATNNANSAAEELRKETLIIYLPNVPNYAAIATTYPNPQIGWATVAIDTSIRWRWNGTEWKNVGIVQNIGIANNITPGTVKGGDVKIETDGTMRVPTIGNPSNLVTKSRVDLVNAVNEIYNDSSLYLMAGFTTSIQTLNLWSSIDGINWNHIGNVYTPPSPDILRDPSIAKIGNKYYIVYSTGWENNYFGLASSTDLLNWTFITNVTISSEYDKAWAPELFIDDDGSVHVFVTCSLSGTSTFKICELHPTNSDFTSWSSNVQLSGNIYTNVIDAHMVKKDGQYCIWYKNEDTKYIEYAKSNTMLTGYVVQGTGDWAGWGANVEGAFVIALPNGTWRIYFDSYQENKHYYSDSTDWITWASKKQVIVEGLYNDLRHVTVMVSPNISIDVFNAINLNINTGSNIATPSLTNGWIESPYANLTKPKYYKDHDGIVRIEGFIVNGTMRASAFTLPPGYRPQHNINCPCSSGENFGLAIITSVGEVIPYTGTNTEFCLNGISFKAT